MGLQELIATAPPKERDTAVLRLASQQKLSQHVQSATSLKEFFSKATQIRSLVEADYVYVYILAGANLLTLDPEGNELRIPVTQAGIAGFVAQTGELVNVKDVYDENELKKVSPSLHFDRTGDEATGYRTKQLLVTPITSGGRTVGVIQAINKVGADAFDFLDAESIRDTGRSLGPMLFSIIQMEKQAKRLRYQERLNEITNSIHAARDLDQILISLRHDILSMFEAERITIYAMDSETEELFSRVKEGEEIKEIRVPVDAKSVAGFAASSRKTVNIGDVYESTELERVHPELRFNSRFDEMTGFRTTQVLAAPIEFEGELLGCAQLINRKGGGRFTPDDEQALRQIADTLGIAFHNQARVGIRRTKHDALADRRLISQKDLKRARGLARENELSLEEVFEREFDIPRSEILEAYAEFFGCEAFSYDDSMEVPGGILATLENRYEDMKSDLWVPVREAGRKVVVAMENPRDVVKRDTIQHFLRGKQIEYRFALTDDIIAAVDHIFGRGGVGGEVSDLVAELETEEEEVHLEEEGEEAAEDDSAIVRLVNRIIEDAFARRATDIHIEPRPDGPVNVRYRIDGDLSKVMDFPGRYRNAVLTRVKVMSDLDIAERRRPQDGKIKFKRWGKLDIELRVATLPTQGGMEDCVLRLLASGKPMKLTDLRMSERNLEVFKKAIARPYGIILCVGPTGSGKTTTLHAALGHLNREDVKIWTAEDPVEITQKGLRQVQINRRAEIDFSRCMRAFLRADPDIIMVGEMRDEETASAGIEASLTGHLVLSTLHTNNAPETVTRLLEMGIDQYSFADALVAVLSQRLVRTLCDCKVERGLPQKEFNLLRREYGDDELFDSLGHGWKKGMKVCAAKDGGCRKCNKTGYRGRMGLHELMVCDDETKSLIYARAKAQDIRTCAIRGGMQTLKQDGIEKFLKGYTTMEKVREVCAV